jgi:hypothetical protein
MQASDACSIHDGVAKVSPEKIRTSEVINRNVDPEVENREFPDLIFSLTQRTPSTGGRTAIGLHSSERTQDRRSRRFWD